ncbi:MAG: hypothetical protein FWC09_03880 [Lachnospiraceae bacterium]|nr:hypothetical protein [Lachnospiraceae bacterium]
MKKSIRKLTILVVTLITAFSMSIAVYAHTHYWQYSGSGHSESKSSHLVFMGYAGGGNAVYAECHITTKTPLDYFKCLSCDQMKYQVAGDAVNSHSRC